jgi:hypothetical protein
LAKATAVIQQKKINWENSIAKLSMPKRERPQEATYSEKFEPIRSVESTQNLRKT